MSAMSTDSIINQFSSMSVSTQNFKLKPSVPIPPMVQKYYDSYTDDCNDVDYHDEKLDYLSVFEVISLMKSGQVIIGDIDDSCALHSVLAMGRDLASIGIIVDEAVKKYKFREIDGLINELEELQEIFGMSE